MIVMSKALDKVWHEGLIYELKNHGISEDLLQLLKVFFSNRKQRLVLNGNFQTGKENAGVPQGSVLGPLLFFIYINNFAEGLKSRVKLFVDHNPMFQ